MIFRIRVSGKLLYEKERVSFPYTLKSALHFLYLIFNYYNLTILSSDSNMLLILETNDDRAFITH